MLTPQWLIVGLGNPGAEYARTRHNVGFMAVDLLAKNWGFSSFHQENKGSIAQGSWKETQGLFLKPWTFMNLSGLSVSQTIRRYSLPIENILVIHDDLGLPLGVVRAKKGGSAGGHKGLQNIDHLLGPDYWRLRIGIGHPGHRDLVPDYVLEAFSSKEKPLLENILDSLPEACSLWVEKAYEKFLGFLTLISKK